MKQLFLLFSAIFSLALFSKAQTPDWQWARNAGQIDASQESIVTVDFFGNTYATGNFNSPTITFGSTILTLVGNDDVFIVKYDNLGNVVWARSAGGTGLDAARSIAVDTSGNVYVSGWYQSASITFETTTMTNAGWTNIFLAKYDNYGNLIWVKSEGGTNNDEGLSVAVDDSGNNIYLAGCFMSSSITFGTYTLTNADNTGNSIDIFLAKYDANGNVQWAKSAIGSGSETARSVAVDEISGNIILAGGYSNSSITFGSTTLTNNGSSDIFLAKFDSNGNVIWAKSAGGGGEDEVVSVSMGNAGNVYLTGNYLNSTITIGSTTLTNAGSVDFFLAKFNNNGNLLWAKRAGGSYVDRSKSVAVDNSENAYVAGLFMSPSITFGSNIFTNQGGQDIFILKYDTNGNIVWAKNAGGSSSELASSIVVDTLQEVYIAGHFSGDSLILGSSTLTNVYWLGVTNFFLGKLYLCTAVPAIPFISASDTLICNGNNVTLTSSNAHFYLWSNGATTQSINVNQEGNYTVTVFDSLGCSTVSSTISLSLTPAIPTIQQDSNYLVSSPAATYQWYFYGTIIPDDTNQICTPTQSGCYTVAITDSNGCNRTSAQYCFVSIDELNQGSISFSIFPNPVSDNVIVVLSDKAFIEILNIEGQIVKTLKINETYTTIDISDFARGMYIVKVKTEKGIGVRKFVKE